MSARDDKQAIGSAPAVRRPSREDIERPDRDTGRASRASGNAVLPPTSLAPAALLRKFGELSVLATIFAVTMAYQFDLKTDWLRGIVSWCEAHGFHYDWDDQVVPLLGHGLPVLELKASVLCLGAGLALAALFVGRLYEVFGGTHVFWRADDALAESASPRETWLRKLPLVAIVAFLAWTFISFLPFAWGPKPPDESPVRGVGGQYHSMVAWCQVAMGLLFFIAVEDLVRTRRFAYKILGLVVGLGVLNALTTMWIQLKLPPIPQLWVKWAPGDSRNELGAFIGHNTGLSSFLMPPVFIVAGMLLGNRERLSRTSLILGGGALGVMAYALVLAQSRAVIPILGLLLVAFWMVVARRCAIRLGRRFWIAACAAGFVLVGSQLVDAPWNPFFRRSVTLAQRLANLTPTHLLTETRLRMLVSSLPVIRDHPLLGTGFGTFQYVIPAAQGDFYLDHPETRIAPTNKRSFHAHNEYLQTLLETGAVGLAIALFGLGSVLLLGWRTMTRTLSLRNTVLQLAVLCSIVALLLHAAVDFPLRIAPLATLLIVLLALWSAGDRLWPIDLRLGPGDGEAPAPRPGRTPAGAPLYVGGRIELSAWAACMLLAASVYCLCGYTLSRWFAAQTLVLRATQAINAYSGGEDKLAPAQMGLVGRSVNDLKLALRLAGDGEAAHHLGHAFFNAANLSASLADKARREGREAEARDRIDAARRGATLGIDAINRSLSESRWHYSYVIRANLNLFLARRFQSPGEDFARRAVDDMTTAALMNPGDPEVLRTVIELRETFGGGTPEELLRFRRLLARFHPGYFRENIFQKAIDARYLGMFDVAEAEMEKIVQAVPEDRAYRFTLASAAEENGHLRKARELAESLAALEPDNGVYRLLLAHISASEGQFDAALEMLDRIPAKPPLGGAILDAARALAALHASRPGEKSHDDAQVTLDRLAASSGQHTLSIGVMLFSVYRDYAGAEGYFRRRLAIADPPPDTQCHALLARCIEQQAGTDRAKLEQAVAEYAAARELADKTFQRALLAKRIQRLRDTLPPKSPAP